jgi:uncharacterized protein YhhL (DUF1145 family)
MNIVKPYIRHINTSFYFQFIKKVFMHNLEVIIILNAS